MTSGAEAAARRAAAFDMRVVFYDPNLLSGVDLSTGYERVHSLKELMSIPIPELVEARYQKFRRMGVYLELNEAEPNPTDQVPSAG